MLKTRILLIVGSAIVIWLIFLLPKVVVNNEAALDGNPQDSAGTSAPQESHTQAPPEVLAAIRQLREQIGDSWPKEKNAIFADSLANLYNTAGKFDSAAWFAEEASKFFNTTESWIKAGDNYYQAYTFALDQDKQGQLAEKAREFFKKVLDANPKNLEVKTKLAMTYVSSNPMQGVTMLREVLAEDPSNELALLNMGMLSIQSGQYERAAERLEELVKINPDHAQGQLLLGIALMNTGDKAGARQQFEKVKQMDKDPAVQATVDSYLNDLK
ncbi:MAG TPA: tetratricopeptide repeat protein [Chryseolinea sp.]